MTPERRRASPAQWALLFAVLTQLLVSFFWMGRLAQKVGDLAAQVTRIEQRLDQRPREVSPSHPH